MLFHHALRFGLFCWACILSRERAREETKWAADKDCSGRMTAEPLFFRNLTMVAILAPIENLAVFLARMLMVNEENRSRQRSGWRAQ